MSDFSVDSESFDRRVMLEGMRRAYRLWSAVAVGSILVGLLLGRVSGSWALAFIVGGLGLSLGCFQIWGTWMNRRAIRDESVRLHPDRLTDLQFIIFPRLRYPEGVAAAARCLQRGRAQDEAEHRDASD